MFQPQQDAARRSARVVDVYPNRSVESREEPVEHRLPGIAESIHTGDDRDVGALAFRRLHQHFHLTGTDNTDMSSSGNAAIRRWVVEFNALQT